MNGDEAAVFGATFFGASLSGRYRAAKYKLKDIVHRNVTGTLVTAEPLLLGQETETEGEGSTTRTVNLLVRGSKIGMKVKYFLRIFW
jgi:hypothetical protein